MFREFLHNLATCLAIPATLLLSLAAMVHGQSWAARTLGLPYGDQRLWHAIETADYVQVERSLAEGARVNAPNELGSGNMPLVMAAAGEHPGLVRLLLRHGADPNLPSPSGVTPLVSAILAERLGAVELLLKNGAKPDAIAPGARSPLIVAVRTKNRAAVELLIAAGANVNAADGLGVTAMQIALEYDEPELEALLRRHGARAGG